MRLQSALFILFLLIASSVSAQTSVSTFSPGAIQQRSRNLSDYYFLREKNDQEQQSLDQNIIEKEGKRESSDFKSEQSFLVKQLQTSPSKILSPQEIRTITKSYENKKISLSELSVVIYQINALYKQKGYITAQAVLAPQKIVDGIVKITLIEGRVGQFFLTGNQSTKTSFINKNLRIEENEILDLAKLEKRIIFLNATQDIQLRALLKPGEEFGSSDVHLEIFEPKPWDVLFFEDNAGREETGLYRSGVNIIHRSVFGLRDQLILSGLWAKGTTDAFISYNLPINSFGTKVGLAYNYTNTSVISGAFEALNIDGDAYSLNASIKQPLWIQAFLRINAHLAYTFKKSRTKFSGVELFNSDVEKITFGFDHTHLSQTYSVVLDHQFHKGFDQSKGDSSFFIYQGEYNLYKSLFKSSYALLRGRLHISDTNFLPSQEQFQVGGVASVRGYEEGFLIADNGYFVSGEYNFPLSWLTNTSEKRKLIDHFRGFVFVDHAETFTRLNLSTDTDDIITSAGFGVAFEDVHNFSARLMMGVPLRKFDENDSPRFHFSVQFRF